MLDTIFALRRGHAAIELFVIVLVMVIFAVFFSKLMNSILVIKDRTEEDVVKISGVVTDVQFLASSSSDSPVVVEFEDGRVCKLYFENSASMVIQKNKVNTFSFKKGKNIVNSIFFEETPK